MLWETDAAEERSCLHAETDAAEERNCLHGETYCRGEKLPACRNMLQRIKAARIKEYAAGMTEEEK